MRPAFRAALAAAVVLTVEGCARPRDAPMDPPESAGLATLAARGEAHYANRELDSAAAVFTRGLERSREAGDVEAEAGFLTWIGTVAYGRDDYPAARALLAQAIDLQHRRGTRTHLWRANNVLGLVAYLEGRYYDALDRHGAAAELAEAVADTVSLAKSWNNVALARIELGDYHEARGLLLRALPVARAGGLHLVEGRVLVNLGMLAVRTGDPDNALRFLEEARAPLRTAEDLDGELNRLGQLGTAYASIGEPGRAIAYLDTALAEARAQESPQEAASNLEQMAGVYRDAGDHARALRMYEEARALNVSLGLEDEAAFDLHSMAEIHLELENPELARRLAAQALDIHQRLGNRLDIMHGLLLLARLDQAAGDGVSALGRLADARRIAGDLGARAPRLAVALTAARIAEHAGDGPRVLEAIAGLRDDLAAGGTDVEWEAHWLEARAHGRAGAWERAAAAGWRALEAVERVRGEFGSGLLRTRYQAARERVYADLVQALLGLGRTEEAFAVADASRGRVLLDHLATLRTDDQSTARELAEEERQLLRQVDQATAELDRLRRDGRGGQDEFRAEVERMARHLDRIRSEYTAALTRAEERHGGARVLLGGSRPSGATVMASLRPGEALVEYFLLPDRVMVFVVTPAGIRCFQRQVDRAALATRVRVARDLAGRPGPPGGASASLEALHEALLGEVRDARALAGVNTLIIVPHGELEYVPFAALRDPRTGRFLVEDFTLLHLPSAAALPVLRGRAAAPMTWSASAFAPFPRDLPASVPETDAFRTAFSRARVVRGRRATERELRAALGATGVVHVATHGVLNPRNPLFSRVELAPGSRRPASEDDGRLEVHEVHRLTIRAPLVVLSGCETGLGVTGNTRFTTGEDYATLTRAFLHAGADNVVATLWRVEDRGAAELAGRFYQAVARALDSGAGTVPLAEALTLAQREMLRDPAWSSPFHWAGFRMTGTGGLAARPAGPVRS